MKGGGDALSGVRVQKVQRVLKLCASSACIV